MEPEKQIKTLVFASLIAKNSIAVAFVEPLYQAYKLRKHFKAYQNVYTSQKYDLVYGDHDSEIAEENGKHAIGDTIDVITAFPKTDLRISFHYKECWVCLYSPKAVKEMTKLQPDIVDRSDYDKFGFGRMFPEALDKVRTDKKLKLRKDAVTNKTPIKKASCHLNTVFDEIENLLRGWEIGKTVNASLDLNDLSCRLISLILFGPNFFEEVGNCKYLCEDGTFKTLRIDKMMQETSTDLDNEFEEPMMHHFPFLCEHSIGEPFSRNKKNITEIHSVMKQYLYKIGVLKVEI
jgi:hypothetical protein